MVQMLVFLVSLSFSVAIACFIVAFVVSLTIREEDDEPATSMELWEQTQTEWQAQQQRMFAEEANDGFWDAEVYEDGVITQDETLNTGRQTGRELWSPGPEDHIFDGENR